MRIFVLIALLTTTACSDQLKDFVRSRPGEQDPQVTAPSGPQQRISPGSGTSSGQQVSSAFVLTTSQRQVSGSQVSSKIYFSQSHPQ